MGILINHTKLARVIKIEDHATQPKDITAVLQSGAWAGKRCLLIGGGPSLEGFDWSSISKELTIGINKAFQFHPVTINYGMDLRFHDELAYPQPNDPNNVVLRKQWSEFTGIKLFLKINKAKFNSDIYTVNSLGRKAISFDLSAGIYPGINSGFGALMLAIALGSTRIGLLGYDLKVDRNRMKTHFHDGYQGVRGRKPDLDSMQSKLDAFRKEFEEFADNIQQNGICVYNLNKDSALNCFPKLNLCNL